MELNGLTVRARHLSFARPARPHRGNGPARTAHTPLLPSDPRSSPIPYADHQGTGGLHPEWCRPATRDTAGSQRYRPSHRGHVIAVCTTARRRRRDQRRLGLCGLLDVACRTIKEWRPSPRPSPRNATHTPTAHGAACDVFGADTDDDPTVTLTKTRKTRRTARSMSFIAPDRQADTCPGRITGGRDDLGCRGNHLSTCVDLVDLLRSQLGCSEGTRGRWRGRIQDLLPGLSGSE